MPRELLARNAKIVSVAPLRGEGGGARDLLGGGGRETRLYWGKGWSPGFIGERVSSLWNLIGASLSHRLCVKY